ncbi:bridging integrator 3 [Crotalus adamanteus]|uniref:Bridging integrator 3 n=1 Tax=Crotalus adamanteus TaxID=8729 RepID=A0AAW1AZQ9_CROAD
MELRSDFGRRYMGIIPPPKKAGRRGESCKARRRARRVKAKVPRAAAEPGAAAFPNLAPPGPGGRRRRGETPSPPSPRPSRLGKTPARFPTLRADPPPRLPLRAPIPALPGRLERGHRRLLRASPPLPPFPRRSSARKGLTPRHRRRHRFPRLLAVESSASLRFPAEAWDRKGAMSWIPFKIGQPKKQIVPKTVERDFEREYGKLQQLEDQTKKLQKDMKKSTDADLAMSKSAVKISSDLLANPLCEQDPKFLEMVMALDTAMKRMDSFNQEKVNQIQKTVIEPLKNTQSSRRYLTRLESNTAFAEKPQQLTGRPQVLYP